MNGLYETQRITGKKKQNRCYDNQAGPADLNQTWEVELYFRCRVLRF